MCSQVVKDEPVEEIAEPELHASPSGVVREEPAQESTGLELHASPKASTRPKTRVVNPRNKFKAARRQFSVPREEPEDAESYTAEEAGESEYTYYTDDEPEVPLPKRAGGYRNRK